MQPDRQLEIAKEEFCNARPAPSRGLVVGLWRDWQATDPDSLLFDDPAQNVALTLHARAYGESVPEAGDRNRLGRLLRDLEESFDPLVPTQLHWGPRANLARDGWPAVESPVMDVWIYRDGPMPSGVLILGEGLPEIREQLFPAAFLVSLGMGTLDTDLVNNGAIRVELPLSGRQMLKIPLNLLGAHPGYLPEDVPENSRQALHRFIRLLRNLADNTGLIRLHEADVDAPSHLHSAILDRAAGAGADAVVWAPGLSPGAPDAAALLPSIAIPSGAALQMRLHGDLLGTPGYRVLENVYRRSTIDRIKTDVTLRRDLNRREAERLERDHEAYRNTPEKDRDVIWGSTVILNIRYDSQADRTLHVDPREVPAPKYYLEDVPVIARDHHKNAVLMGKILDDITAAENRPDSPVRRLAAGRLLDAAVRGCAIVDDPAFTTAFDAWSQQVRPMLWLEWRAHFDDAGVRPADVFTRNTVVHTVQADGDRGREMLMVPHAVVHQQRTAVLVDRRRRATVYLDAARKPRAARPARDTRPTADPWEAVEEMGRVADVEETTADAAVVEALAADPVAGVTRVLEILTERETEPETNAFEMALGQAVEQTTRLRALRRAAVALVRGAPQTTRAQLAMVGTDNPVLDVRAALMEALLEYSYAGGDLSPVGIGQLAAGEGAGGDARVVAAVSRAREQDPEFADKWLGVLASIDVGSAFGRLQHGLPALEDLLKKDDVFAAWTSRIGVETARLARNLEAAAGSLDGDGEHVADALAKLGLALEGSFLDEFAGANRDLAAELIAILVGDARTFGKDIQE